MKDTELRGIILNYFYDRRREKWSVPRPQDLGDSVTKQDILQVCDQLAQHGMLEWTSRGHGIIKAGLGKITAFGIDVVEEKASPKIKVEFVQNQKINMVHLQIS